MTEFIQTLVGNDYLATAVMSFVPLIELKGGIVFAQSAGINFVLAFLLAYAGSTLAFIPVYWLLKPILNLLRKIKWFKTFADKVESFFQTKADETMEKQKNKRSAGKYSEVLIKQIGVFVFIAIPLPMTGVWTGTAIAVFLNLKFRNVIWPAMLGNFIAGAIITVLALLCSAIGVNLDYVLYALFGLALVLLVFAIIKVAKQKPESNNKNSNIDDNGASVK